MGKVFSSNRSSCIHRYNDTYPIYPWCFHNESNHPSRKSWKKHVSTIHFLQKKTKFKRWTTLLERMPKMSTSYCLWLCSCLCLFQTLIFLNFKKQLWMQRLPSKLGGVGVPFFGGNAAFSPVFKEGGKVLGESWQSHPHLASILECEWSTWKHVYSARVCCFVETGSVREAFFLLGCVFDGRTKRRWNPCPAGGLTSAVLWILLAKELCWLHSLTFSEGAMFTRISSDISGGTLEWGRICETKIVVSSTVCLYFWLNSISIELVSALIPLPASAMQASPCARQRLCRRQFLLSICFCSQPWHGWVWKPSKYTPAQAFRCLGDLPRMGDWVSIAALPATAAHLTCTLGHILVRQRKNRVSQSSHRNHLCKRRAWCPSHCWVGSNIEPSVCQNSRLRLQETVDARPFWSRTIFIY